MKNIKDLAYVAVIALTVLAFGSVVWFFASSFRSLSTQVSQNTQNVQSIAQYINQKTSPSPAASAK
jgi:predicted PurR-regulated permease PerM